MTIMSLLLMVITVVDSLFTLAQPTELTVSASINNNDCATDSLGVIELNTTGGVGGYNFSWSTNSGMQAQMTL